MPKETSKETAYILSVPLLIRVDREDDGVPYVTLDKIRNYLTEAAIIEWDQEGCGTIDEEHALTSMSVDWEQLQHGMVGKTVWKCQSCDAPAQEIDNFELLDAGNPWCSECDGPMEMIITNRIKCVRVEWASDYSGGDYGKVGVFAYIPFDLCDEIKNPEGRCVMDDDKALKIAFEKVTGENPIHIVHYTLDEPVDQDGNEWTE